MRFLRNISDNSNTQSSRARRRKMERELKKLGDNDTRPSNKSVD